LQLVATGKESLTAMGEGDLRKVVEALKAKGFKPTKGRRYKTAPRGDLRYVHALWSALGRAGVLDRPDRAGLNAFVRSRFGDAWGEVPIDIDALRDADKINAVVKALQAMCRRNGVETRGR
ncbi:MAG: phage protein GemA/Gp16 family protein, partial [Shimia sp.]